MVFIDIFKRIPMPMKVLISDAPPKLMNGSVNPVTGSIPSATPMFTNACIEMLKTTPNARYIASGSSHFCAMWNPRIVR